MNGDSIEKLAKLFEEFPGIGKKQAQRFVYFLIRKDIPYIQDLVNEIAAIKQEVQQCPQCLRYHQEKEQSLCRICSQADGKQMMIVERDADFHNIEKTKFYGGKYFILKNMKKLREESYGKLMERIRHGMEKEGLEEVIFALSIRPESEHERFILSSLIKKEFPQLKLTTLGRGLSSGIELEYSDRETLRYAIEKKIDL